MNKDFLGDPILMVKYQEVTKDLKQTYKSGTALCFAGSHGVGKSTVVTNILKRAVEKGFSALYVTLNDVITALISSPETKAEARNKFLTVDFLVIDEFDPRYRGSDNQSDLFGRVLEDIIRIRAENSLPIFMCTNALDVADSFKGPLKISLKSLMNYVTQISVLGADLRKSGK